MCNDSDLDGCVEPKDAKVDHNLEKVILWLINPDDATPTPEFDSIQVRIYGATVILSNETTQSLQETRQVLTKAADHEFAFGCGDGNKIGSIEVAFGVKCFASDIIGSRESKEKYCLRIPNLSGVDSSYISLYDPDGLLKQHVEKWRATVPLQK